MDNNYYNNYNSQNNNQQGAQGSNAGGYQSYGAGNGQNMNGYAYNSYQNNYNPYQQPGQQQRPKKPKKQHHGFGATLGKTVAIALAFGLVAGGVFTGVSFIGTKALGIGSSKTQTESSGSKDTGDSASVQQTKTGEAGDLLDVSSIAKEAMPSIVAITNMGTISYQTFWGIQQQQSESCGSGIIINQDDDYLYIVTNNHVVEDADELTVQFADNETVTCEVKGTDASDDLAVVKVAISDIKADTLNNIKVATVADENQELVVGQGVIAIGNALGYGQSVTNGIISALGRSVTVQDEQTGQTIVNNNMIQTNAAINPGNSGGALLNAKGEVIGINSAKYSDTQVEGFGYAIPITDAMPIVEQLITREKVDESKTAFLGIQGQDVSADIAKAYNMPEGIYLYEVVKGSPAEDAGLRQGDIITKFDKQTVRSMSELKQQMAYYKAGEKVKITIERLENGKYEEHSIEVKLGSAPATQK